MHRRLWRHRGTAFQLGESERCAAARRELVLLLLNVDEFGSERRACTPADSHRALKTTETQHGLPHGRTEAEADEREGWVEEARHAGSGVERNVDEPRQVQKLQQIRCRRSRALASGGDGRRGRRGGREASIERSGKSRCNWSAGEAATGSSWWPKLAARQQRVKSGDEKLQSTKQGSALNPSRPPQDIRASITSWLQS